MNFKTTVGLTVALIVVLVGLFAFKPQQNAVTAGDRSTAPATTFEQDLFPDPWTDPVKLTCIKAGQPAWVFERTDDLEDEDDQVEWALVEPIHAAVPKYEPDGIANRLKRLKYQVKYAEDDPETITPTDAGLEPPKFDIKLEDRDGKTFAIQVGKAASTNETYVRLGDSGDIFVARSSLANLIKKRLEDYRDKSLFTFDADDAKSIEVVHRPDDGDTVTYRLAKHDGDWVFEEPFNADAVDKIVASAVRSLSRLRAGEWVESDADDQLGRFGLDQPRLEITVVCEKKVPIEEEDDEGDDDSTDAETEADDETAEETSTDQEPEYEIKTQEYRIHIAGRSPVGRDTALYARLAGESAVATVSKGTVDTITPSVEKWRNMELTSAKVSKATRVRIQTGDGSETFIKENGRWVFEEDEIAADSDALNELLKKIEDVKAVSFVDDIDPMDRRFGLASPRVVIVATIPGQDTPERIVIGRPTDDVAKRLYFARRGEASAVAKIRATDAILLLRSPRDYLDPQIFAIPKKDLQRLTVDRSNPISGKPETLTLAKQDGKWRLIEPVDADTDAATTNKLVNTFANLRAESVATQSGSPAAFGLDAPIVKVAVTYTPPPLAARLDFGKDAAAETETDSESTGESADTESDADKTDDSPAQEEASDADSSSDDQIAETPALPEAQPDRTVELWLAESDHKLYAKRSNSPAIYKLRRGVLDTVLADFHAKSIFNFEQSQVTSFSVSSGEVTHQFEKVDDRWVYGNEPDLPLDTRKVDELLTKLSNLKLQRFVEYAAADLDAYDLGRPANSVTIRTDDGRPVTLLISEKVCSLDREKSRYAVIEGTGDVFLVTPDTVSDTDISIDELEQAADS